MEVINSEGKINFDEVYRRYFDMVLKVVCYKYTKDKDTALEYCQNGFIKLLKVMDKYDNIGSLEGFIKKVVTNDIIDHIRGESRRKETFIDTEWDNYFIEDESNMPFEEDESKYSKYSVSQVKKLLEEIPPSYKKVFELYYFDGLRHKEISTYLGIAEGTSKANLCKCRQKLQKMIISLN